MRNTANVVDMIADLGVLSDASGNAVGCILIAPLLRGWGVTGEVDAKCVEGLFSLESSDDALLRVLLLAGPDDFLGFGISSQ